MARNPAMKSVLYDRLLRREQGDITSYSAVRGMYGDKSWIDDMDIVNELGGHTGCVNALRYAYYKLDAAFCVSITRDLLVKESS